MVQYCCWQYGDLTTGHVVSEVVEFHVEVFGPSSVLVDCCHLQWPTILFQEPACDFRSSGFYSKSWTLDILQEFHYWDNFPHRVWQSRVLWLYARQLYFSLQLGFPNYWASSVHNYVAISRTFCVSVQWMIFVPIACKVSVYIDFQILYCIWSQQFNLILGPS